MKYLYVNNISGLNHIAIPDVCDIKNGIVDIYGEYRVNPLVRTWFLENLNSSDWFFDKFSSMFYFKNEEDFVAFKLAWA